MEKWLTKEERDAILARVEAVKPYKNTFDNIVQPVVGFYEHAKEDIPRLLDELEAAEAREAKLVEALRWIRDYQRDYGESLVEALDQVKCHAGATLKELGIPLDNKCET